MTKNRSFYIVGTSSDNGLEKDGKILRQFRRESGHLGGVDFPEVSRKWIGAAEQLKQDHAQAVDVPTNALAQCYETFYRHHLLNERLVDMTRSGIIFTTLNFLLNLRMGPIS